MSEKYSLAVKLLTATIFLVAAIINMIVGPHEPRIWLFVGGMLVLPVFTASFFLGWEHVLKQPFRPDQLRLVNARLFRWKFGPEWKQVLEESTRKNHEWGYLLERVPFMCSGSRSV